MLNIDDPRVPDPHLPLFRLGFRPFFLGAAAVAALLIPLWIWYWYLPESLPLFSQAFWSPVIPLWWHPHEMIFGFGLAVVVGFLLTASANWTGQPGMKGPWLAVTWGCWLAARLLLVLPLAVPLWLPALMDAAFLLLVVAKLGGSIYKVRQWRNIAFPLLLTLALAVNMLSYAALAHRNLVFSFTLWEGMIWWMALMITFVGGRVIPFFTAVRVKFDKPNPLPWLDGILFALLALLLVQAFSDGLPRPAEQGILLAAGVLQLVRWWRWRPLTTLKEPLLWSLHLSYLCVPLTLLGMAWSLGDPFAERQWLHLLAVGAMGGMILAMMSRVSLGHTGRPLYEGPVMAPAFGLILLAAALRALGPLWWPAQVAWWHSLAATAWFAAFALFLWHYAGILSRPRLDGRPG